MELQFIFRLGSILEDIFLLHVYQAVILMVIFAEYVTYRDTDKGSIYISNLCEVFAKNGKTENFVDLLGEVRTLIQHSLNTENPSIDPKFQYHNSMPQF